MSASRWFAVALPLFVVFGATACKKPPPEPKHYTSISPLTTAPPGAIAEYVQDLPREVHNVRITEGIAMAFECRDWNGAPCVLEGSTVGDDKIVGFRPAYGDLAQTVAYGRRSSTQQAYLNRSLFVVVGRHAGRSDLTLRTGTGTVVLSVDVFAAKP